MKKFEEKKSEKVREKSEQVHDFFRTLYLFHIYIYIYIYIFLYDLKLEEEKKQNRKP